MFNEGKGPTASNERQPGKYSSPLHLLKISILIQAAIFRLISGGNRNAMLFDHFLTPHHRGTAERESEYSRSAGKREYVFSLRRCRCRCRGDGGGGVGHKNACLNENVSLSPFAQLGRLFCLLGLRPRRQKSRPRFAKGERILHSCARRN